MVKKATILTGLFVFFVVFSAPAQLLTRFAPEQKQLSISGLQGSLWSGEVAQLTFNQYRFNQLNFSISPLQLLLARLALDLEIGKGDISGDLALVLGTDYQNHLEINQANLTLDTQQLLPFIPVRGVEIDGQLTTQGLDLILENQRPVWVQGEVAWTNAKAGYVSQQWPLGDLALQLATQEETGDIVGKLKKTRNVLGLEGQVVLSKNGMLELVGSIATDIDKDLYAAMALFNDGKPANGRLPIKFKQKIF